MYVCRAQAAELYYIIIKKNITGPKLPEFNLYVLATRLHQTNDSSLACSKTLENNSFKLPPQRDSESMPSIPDDFCSTQHGSSCSDETYVLASATAFDNSFILEQQ
mmetsp:Transcript_15065/g.32489  ORF Transcript_15065/g.32489 Transcript_15065/m.32489 type:complete len:106 (+) Transcript_15065:890-1207(+)